jgi:hypothetical protein
VRDQVPKVVPVARQSLHGRHLMRLRGRRVPRSHADRPVTHQLPHGAATAPNSTAAIADTRPRDG